MEVACENDQNGSCVAANPKNFGHGEEENGRAMEVSGDAAATAAACDHHGCADGEEKEPSNMEHCWITAAAVSVARRRCAGPLDPWVLARCHLAYTHIYLQRRHYRISSLLYPI